ncbi:hypothetical protein AB0J80_09355 [Actinoplanes sp. NPDC049548]|uniref:hypothetical protein n=1 Tax=Actinoplanes sp. NPDC049548 TaxID=3155152 RepID=UPI0034159DAF
MAFTTTATLVGAAGATAQAATYHNELHVNRTMHIKDDDSTDEIGDFTLESKILTLPNDGFLLWDRCEGREVRARLEVHAKKDDSQPGAAKVHAEGTLLEGISCDHAGRPPG